LLFWQQHPTEDAAMVDRSTSSEPLRFDQRLVVKVPAVMETKLREAANASMTNSSDYARRAIVEKLQRDGFAPSAAAAA
jgi:hypothetical protein